jgi:hypothetical protein
MPGPATCYHARVLVDEGHTCTVIPRETRMVPAVVLDQAPCHGHLWHGYHVLAVVATRVVPMAGGKSEEL